MGKMPKNCMKITKSSFLGPSSGSAQGKPANDYLEAATRGVLKNFVNLQEIPVLESLFDKVAGLKVY